MAAIIPYLNDKSVFNPADLKAMSMALDDVCRDLQIEENSQTARELIAMRIIQLARHGERSPTKLRDHIVAEARGGSGC